MAITKAALEKIFIGSNTIDVVEYQSGVAIDDALFATAHKFFTLEGSITFSQDPPTKSEIKVSQFSTPIKVSYEDGEFTITGMFPSVAKEVLEFFFYKNDATPALLTGFDSSLAIDLKSKIIESTIKMVDQTGKMAIIIPRCEIIGNLSWDDVEKQALGVNFTITPLVNPSGKGDLFFYGI